MSRTNKFKYDTCIHEAGHVFIAHSLGMETIKIVIDFKNDEAYSNIGILDIDPWKASVLMAGWAADKVIGKKRASFTASYGATADRRLLKQLKLDTYMLNEIRKDTIKAVQKDKGNIIKFADFLFSRMKNDKICISKKDIKEQINRISYAAYNIPKLGLKLLG